MTVDVDDLKRKQQIRIENMTLNYFMEVHQFDKMPSHMTGVVTYFSLGEEIRGMAEDLFSFQDSHLFKVCWEKQARQFVSEAEEEDDPDDHDDNELLDLMATPEMILEEIFAPCMENYKGIYASLRDGSITLEEVNELFGAYKGKYEELKQELDLMCRLEISAHKKEKQWIHNTVQQIEQYHELHLAVTSAEIILMVKETLRLQGDFSVLETLAEVVSGHILS